MALKHWAAWADLLTLSWAKTSGFHPDFSFAEFVDYSENRERSMKNRSDCEFL